MNLFISPPEKTSWTMTPSEFVGHLLERWPSARVRTTDNPEFSPAWKIDMPGGVLMGDFYPPLSGVIFNGSTLEDMATFALWFRSLVPAKQPLLFYEEGFNWDMELKTDTTAEEIYSTINGE